MPALACLWPCCREKEWGPVCRDHRPHPPGTEGFPGWETQADVSKGGLVTPLSPAALR